MRREISSISVCNPPGQHKRFTVTICGARLTAGRRGRSDHPIEAHTEAIRSGLRSTGLRAAWATGFSTSFGPKASPAISADSAALPMAEPPGRVRSVFLTLLNGERSTSPATATFTLALGIVAAAFGVFAPPMPRTRLSLPLSTRSQQSTWAAAYGTARQLIQTDWQDRFSWPWIGPAALRTTTFTWWQLSGRPASI